MRKKYISINPAAAADIPTVAESNIGKALSPDELRRLLDEFRGSTLFPIILTAAMTGARLGELLALRWSDLNISAKTLTIARAIEQTRGGRRFKLPKTKRGTRTIALDDGLLGVLLTEREKYLRLIVGVGNAASIDLSLVRLPEDALLFPSPEGVAELNFTRTRNPHGLTKQTRMRFRRAGFPTLRFHDLRVTSISLMLAAGCGCTSAWA